MSIMLRRCNTTIDVSHASFSIVIVVVLVMDSDCVVLLKINPRNNYECIVLSWLRDNIITINNDCFDVSALEVNWQQFWNRT